MILSTYPKYPEPLSILDPWFHPQTLSVKAPGLGRCSKKHLYRVRYDYETQELRILDHNGTQEQVVILKRGLYESILFIVYVYVCTMKRVNMKIE